MKTERFSRTELLIGPEKLKQLQESSVTIIGLGAVGSYCTEAIARAGVKKLRLVDFDVIRESNINRHIWAFSSTIDVPKSKLGLKRVLDINPYAKVEELTLFTDSETMPHILDNHPNLVLDAIDSLNPKVQVLEACWKANVPVISCMGAATRTDPFAIRIDDLMDTTVCPLAKRVRKMLKDRGVGRGITCVYSIQNQDAFALSTDTLIEEGAFVRGRPRRKLGSLSTLTGIFGLIMAQAALEYLLPDVFLNSRK